jgi:hypothetical protein
MLTIVFLFIRAKSQYSNFYECFTNPALVSTILQKPTHMTKVGLSVPVARWDVKKYAQLLQDAGYNVIISENKEGDDNG